MQTNFYSIKAYVGLIVLLWLCLATCGNAEISLGSDASASGTSPVTINFNKSDSKEIISYGADVTVTQINNRHIDGSNVSSKYRLRTKIIEGVLYSRIDFTPLDTNQRAVSVITDGARSIAFDTVTQDLISNISVPNSVGTSTIGRIMARVDIETTRATLQKMSYDISADLSSSSRYMICTAPASVYSKMPVLPNAQMKSMSIIFDTVDQTFAGSIQEQILPNGECITTSTSFEYQIVNDQPILIGQTIQEEHKISGVIDVSGDALPQIIDLDTIPEVSQSEIDAAKTRGLVAQVDPPLGDRSDPSYIITTISSFDNIDINTGLDSDYDILVRGVVR